ncbi:serine/threonine protein kinase [Calothrix sp. FACHB-1219]|uniref:serine/threonine-protein kinase n=1 Tax=unclassified Calothrix TaxID=2619626 RepID=UPI00168A2C13|nr:MULTISPECIES: serine/threonine-protein kinase [unclassified Calothrix]MBD2203036.1 serine/threonine protein kinase [Calothrix sp. FACHB-168]MBD2218636.1 serine/threonine protein kinase [Calothrix sp. FACHB-1219]
MNRFPPQLTQLHEWILQETRLGRMCGSSERFRDRYEILKVLGRGGFGITFLAKNAVLPGKPLCVIKQLCPKVTSIKSWERACQRFKKEAKALGELGSHPQIPMLLDYFEIKGEFYLVQEYIRGSTLAREVKKSGTKSEAAVKQFLQELLPVLKYLHQHGVIHRDIKPHNLLRCEDDERIVLIDFGAVKQELVNAEQNSIHRQATTNFVGTMGYAPPEQFSLTPVYASDIYALGVTCIYLLTGKSPLELSYDHDTGEISWQKEVKVSDSFAQILGKMVKISLKERFKSAQEVLRALELENYLPTLTNCLTTQPPRTKTYKQPEVTQTYLTPAQRTAIAIREWKARGNKK